MLHELAVRHFGARRAPLGFLAPRSGIHARARDLAHLRGDVDENSGQPSAAATPRSTAPTYASITSSIARRELD